MLTVGCGQSFHMSTSFIQSFINFKRRLSLVFSIHQLQKEIKISFSFFRRNSYSHWQGNRQETQCSTRINVTKPYKFFEILQFFGNLLKSFNSIEILHISEYFLKCMLYQKPNFKKIESCCMVCQRHSPCLSQNVRFKKSQASAKFILHQT